MKKKMIFALGALLLLTPVMGSKAAGTSPADNGWGNSNGRIVYQQEEGSSQVVFDTADLQKLYELAK